MMDEFRCHAAFDLVHACPGSRAADFSVTTDDPAPRVGGGVVWAVTSGADVSFLFVSPHIRFCPFCGVALPRAICPGDVPGMPR